MQLANGRGCPLVVHCWADLQSVHGLCCNGNITQMRKEVATSTGRRTFSPWATNMGKNNRWISTFHSGKCYFPSVWTEIKS